MKDYALLVNTCDKYRDAWPMFFYLLKKNWKDEWPDIYVNTESCTEEVKGLKVSWLLNEKSDTVIDWGERLINAVNRIENEFVVLMLEDFYYENPIKIDIIDKCVSYMKAHKEIISFQMVPAGECAKASFSSDESILNGFVKREKKGKYKIIAGPTIWRKSDLIRLTKKSDSPWDWEYFGSLRTWYYGKDVYCWYSKKEAIFSYDIVHGGAIHRGKWVGYKMRELCEKYNYHLNYGEREIVEDWMKDEGVCKPPKLYKRLNKAIINRLKYLENIVYGVKLRLIKGD